MEENERVLFQVIDHGETTSVRFKTESADDIAKVAMAIDDIMRKTPALRKMMLAVSMAAMFDKDFKKTRDENTVDVPDFDKLLKDLK